jgi:hypothetical protein
MKGYSRGRGGFGCSGLAPRGGGVTWCRINGGLQYEVLIRPASYSTTLSSDTPSEGLVIHSQDLYDQRELSASHRGHAQGSADELTVV